MKNLYVGNLPHSTTEADLRQIFEAHGAVEKITLVTDRDTGRCQEADQLLQNARRNTHGNRDNGTRPNAGINENRRSLPRAVSMR
jgi:RNA recognition motif-containing protein